MITILPSRSLFAEALLLLLAGEEGRKEVNGCALIAILILGPEVAASRWRASCCTDEIGRCSGNGNLGCGAEKRAAEGHGASGVTSIRHHLSIAPGHPICKQRKISKHEEERFECPHAARA